MNLLDIAILVAAVAGAVAGFRLGFLTRTASWVGLALGLLLAARVVPWFVESFADESAAGIVIAVGMILLLGAMIGQTLGFVLGRRLRLGLPLGRVRILDQCAGAAAGVVGIAALVWLVLPVMSESPGFFATQSRNSVVARTLDGRFPPAPDTLVALRSLVGEDRFPRVFDALRPAPEVGPLPSSSGLSDQVAGAAAASTVKIVGEACGRIQEGTGFTALAPELVVTNAHVIAGETTTVIERDDGVNLDATVVAFDPGRDLAVLRVPGLDRTPLTVADGDVGTTGGVFGHPGGALLRIAPFSVGQQVTARGTDIYDHDTIDREVLVLAASLAPGDSGAALVDGDGTVVGIAFAIAPDDPQVAYALDTSELDEVVAGGLVEQTNTGGCVDG